MPEQTSLSRASCLDSFSPIFPWIMTDSVLVVATVTVDVLWAQTWLQGRLLPTTVVPWLFPNSRQFCWTCLGFPHLKQHLASPNARGVGHFHWKWPNPPQLHVLHRFICLGGGCRCDADSIATCSVSSEIRLFNSSNSLWAVSPLIAAEVFRSRVLPSTAIRSLARSVAWSRDLTLLAARIVLVYWHHLESLPRTGEEEFFLVHSFQGLG